MTRYKITEFRKLLKEADSTPQTSDRLCGIAVFRDADCKGIFEVWLFYWIDSKRTCIKQLDGTVIDVLETAQEKDFIEFSSAFAPNNYYLESYIGFNDLDQKTQEENIYSKTKFLEFMIGECLD